MSNRYCSLKSLLTFFKLLLKSPLSSPHKSAVLIFFLRYDFSRFFAEISLSPLCHIRKPKTAIISKRHHINLIKAKLRVIGPPG